MAASMSLLTSPSVAARRLTTTPLHNVNGNSNLRVSAIKRAFILKRSLIRCEAGDDSGPMGVREVVDKKTKVDISKEDILRNQEQNESERRSVFGAVPSSGSFYPRPEVERRPETGDRSFGSLFAFDGAAPETINGRLAMVGFVWALLAEKATGLGVREQLFNAGSSGLVNFVVVVQLFTFASVIPFLNGESTDARKWGPFTAKAERWNGRLAMLGFAALVIDEAIRGMPYLSAIHH